MTAVAGSEEAPPPALRVPAWDCIDRLVHGFFGRQGGTSVGAWASLNLGEHVGDDREAVRANWRHVGTALSGLRFVRMQQVHGARVMHVERALTSVGEADAMFTATPGLGLAVLTADCVPLLGVAPDRGAVLIAHAGWRGTLAGVATAALAAARRQLGIRPDEWLIALGPSIGACCYEVETSLGQQFVDRFGPMPEAWHPAGERGRLDLRAANRVMLVACGVPEDRIETAGPCTSCRSDAYFSHRRSRGRTGRQLSVIGIQTLLPRVE
jgi:YfiH family protein